MVAMPIAGASRSARMVVLARAHLTGLGVVDDPYARGMLPRAWLAGLSLLNAPGLRGARRHPTFAYLGARTRFYDEFVTTALDGGLAQVVVVAAGYDSRAWRLARQGVTFFEVDLPGTQADKRSRAPAGGPVYVPADVTAPDLAERLTSAGFRPGERSAFLVEGLLMYLTADQAATLLRVLAELGGPGSRLATNLGVGVERAGGGGGRVAGRVMAAGGEEYRFRLAPAHAPGFLAAAGWTADRILTGPQLGEAYLRGTALAGVAMTTAGFTVAATAG
jgi:methyltransferase (TIGR00027 family)